MQTLILLFIFKNIIEDKCNNQLIRRRRIIMFMFRNVRMSVTELTMAC
jgi:hypothetical protein